MTAKVRSFSFVCFILFIGHAAMAQSLAPRAYVITPTNANALTFTWAYYNGSLNLNGTIPVTGATGTYSVPILSYYHSFSLFGRSANVTGFLPYGVGTFQGSLLGTHRQIYRSGLLDVAFRLSVNLKGGPAMALPQFMKWKQKTLLGVSLIVIAPTGQYDPDSPHQLGHQSMGVQTGAGLFATLGKLGARCVRRSVVLYDERCLLLSTQSGAPNGKAHRLVRRPLELRLQQAEMLGFAGRKLLVRRCHQLEQHPQFGHSPDQFAHRRNLFLSNP